MLFSSSEIPRQTSARVQSLAEKKRLPQSVLLSGGSEKLREKCALELAGAVLCPHTRGGEPCGSCPACKKIRAGVHPDLIALRPEKDKKSVSVAAVRELVLDRLYVAPNEAADKIYVFYAAEELSVLIQNALLKTIEEPPPFVMFIFLCDQRDRLLTTVVSRLTEFPLGDALTAQRKTTEAQILETAVSFITALCRGDEFDIMKSTAPMVKNRAMMKKTAEKIILIVRDAAAIHAAEPLSGAEDAALRLRTAFDLPALYALKARMEDIASFAAANANENLLITQFSSFGAEILKKRKP